MKLSFSLAVHAMAVLSSVSAFTATGGSVSLNKKVSKLDFKQSSVPQLTLESPKDILNFAVEVESQHPARQSMYVFSDTKGLDHVVFASTSKYTPGLLADLSVNKLPDVLKKAPLIRVSIVVANAHEEEPNLNQVLVDLVPTQELKDSVNHVKPFRLGPLPEIHHVFRTEESTVNSVVPVVFSGLAVALLVVLIGAWASVLKNELFTASHGSTWKAALLSTLAYAEYTFLQYYLGASIFATLFQVVLLAGPFLFFGSRALSALGKQRAAGKA